MSVRETLFGDLPLAGWAGDGNGEPWASFATAARQLAERDRDGAVRTLRSIVARDGLESRHALGAWQALRSSPPQRR
jgi:hypothetical protein